MKKIRYVVLALVFLAAGITPSYAKTFYIRVDGGTRYDSDVPSGNCNGLKDAPYPGKGTNQDCAFAEVSYLAFDGLYTIAPKWVVTGGDTIVIHAGKYRVGYRGPNANDHQGLALAGNPYAFGLPAIPGGTIANPTRIIGDGSTTTQIYGGYGASSVLDLSTGAFSVSGLELTDHAQCNRISSVGSQCNSSYPLTDYAANGLNTSVKTSSLSLTDINIHGFISSGIIGPIGGLTTVNGVRIAFNVEAGWNFDDGTGTKSVNGSVVATNLSVIGNGFEEEYPIVHPNFPALVGFDQNNTGYGDGLGTPDTALSFSCDHCTFKYNTQDGFDALHDFDGKISITNSVSEGNMGQQWKMGSVASVLFENNETIHNCNRLSQAMPGASATYNTGLSLFCRASGDGIAMSVKDGGTYALIGNSYIGYGATSYDIGCSAAPATCTTPVITFQNNLNIGLANPFGGELPGTFYLTGFGPEIFKAISNNIFFNFKNVPVGSSSFNPEILNQPSWTVSCKPDETGCVVSKGEAILDATDFHLTGGSGPAIGAGASVGAAKDFDGNPWGSIRDIGAFKYVAGTATGTPPVTSSPTNPPGTPTPTNPVTTNPVTGNPVGSPVTVTGSTPTASFTYKTTPLWYKVAGENDPVVSIPANAVVRFGAGTSWVYKFFPTASSVPPTNAFWTDPIVGTVKEMDVLLQVIGPQ